MKKIYIKRKSDATIQTVAGRFMLMEKNQSLKPTALIYRAMSEGVTTVAGLAKYMRGVR